MRKPPHEPAGATGGDFGGFWYDGNEFDSWKAAVSADDGATYAAAQEVCEDEGIDPYDWEVYEHWIVSEWRATRLEAKGQKVDLYFAGLTVWARTTTGQSILMEAVIVQIVADLQNAR